jgi:hypothetical protein
MTEVGLIYKWKKDVITKQKIISLSSSLQYGKYIFNTKNIVADNIYEAGYVALSLSRLRLAFDFLFLGSSLSLTALISELVYHRVLGFTKQNTDL